jgi:FlaA1/EpsC-like NDP-sugar epimerase
MTPLGPEDRVKGSFFSGRKIALLIYSHDLCMAAAAMAAALLARYRFEPKATPYGMIWDATLAFTIVAALVFPVFKLHRGVWRFTALNDLWRIVQAVGVSSLLVLPVLFLINRLVDFPRSAPVLVLGAAVLFLSFGRILTRALASGDIRAALSLEDRTAPAMVLVGTGRDAADFLRENRRAAQPMRIAGLVTTNDLVVGRMVDGCPVLGPLGRLSYILRGLSRRERQLPQVVVVDPRPSRALLEQIVSAAGEAGVRVARARAMAGGASALAPVQAADLLGRPPRVLDQKRALDLVAGKSVLVTGAGGTIGSELTRQILSYGPERVILFDASEYNLYAIDRELTELGITVPWSVELGDVRDQGRLSELFTRERPQVVVHAAALKHVPLMEANPSEAVMTNLGGAVQVARLARDLSEAFVFISTDKAVNPTNVMGATKRAAERAIQALMVGGKAKAAIVRFGNVLGSAGSVVPLFERQIAAGGPVTLTHPDMVRFFMTVQEAAGLVLQAAALPHQPGAAAIYVLDMGEPVRIEDLARRMIQLHGLRPERDIALVHSGLRPGEKLFEEVFYAAEDVRQTEADGVMAARTDPAHWSDLKGAFEGLMSAAQSRDERAVIAGLVALEPGFQPDPR